MSDLVRNMGQHHGIRMGNLAAYSKRLVAAPRGLRYCEVEMTLLFAAVGSWKNKPLPTREHNARRPLVAKHKTKQQNIDIQRS